MLRQGAGGIATERRVRGPSTASRHAPDRGSAGSRYEAVEDAAAGCRPAPPAPDLRDRPSPRAHRGSDVRARHQQHETRTRPAQRTSYSARPDERRGRFEGADHLSCLARTTRSARHPASACAFSSVAPAQPPTTAVVRPVLRARGPNRSTVGSKQDREPSGTTPTMCTADVERDRAADTTGADETLFTALADYYDGERRPSPPA